MSVDTIIALNASEAIWDDLNPQPAQSVKMAAYNDGVDKEAYLAANSDIADWPASAYIVGAWDDATGLQAGETYDPNTGDVIGSPLFPVQSDYADYIRPLGNQAGRATGLLDSLRWAGHPEQKFLFEDYRYTPINSPFTLEIIRQDYGSDALPWDNGTTYQTGDFATSGGMWVSLQDGNIGNTPFGGSPFWEFINQSGPWGWVVKMLSDDPSRDITSRAIGVYSDPECTIFQYTTGTYINDGKYGDVYYTECPSGNRLTNLEQVNFALLLGSAQEGFMNLPIESDVNTSLYWSSDQ